MIEINNLSKKFWDKNSGEFFAVKDVNLSINKGEIFGLLGPNGAGKTTLLRMLIGILKPSSGDIIYDNLSLLGNEEYIKGKVSFLSENTKLYEKLSIDEVLNYLGQLYEIPGSIFEDRKYELYKTFQMFDFKDKAIGKLSTGQKQKCSIARVMLNNPEIYILDEPTLGLDVITSRSIIDFIKNEAKNGKTIIFSSHYMEEVEALCDRICLFHKGEILDIGTLDEFREKNYGNNLREIFLNHIDKLEGGANE